MTRQAALKSGTVPTSFHSVTGVHVRDCDCGSACVCLHTHLAFPGNGDGLLSESRLRSIHLNLKAPVPQGILGKANKTIQ